MKIFHVLAFAALACLSGPHSTQAQAPLKSRVSDVPDDLQHAVIDHLQHTFIYPDLVIWHFEYMQPYPTGGIAICGNLDLPDSTRSYELKQPFYAHYVGGQVAESGIVSARQNEDPVASVRTAREIACGKP